MHVQCCSEVEVLFFEWIAYVLDRIFPACHWFIWKALDEACKLVKNFLPCSNSVLMEDHAFWFMLFWINHMQLLHVFAFPSKLLNRANNSEMKSTTHLFTSMTGWLVILVEDLHQNRLHLASWALTACEKWSDDEKPEACDHGIKVLLIGEVKWKRFWGIGAETVLETKALWVHVQNLIHPLFKGIPRYRWGDNFNRVDSLALVIYFHCECECWRCVHVIKKALSVISKLSTFIFISGLWPWTISKGVMPGGGVREGVLFQR